VRQKGQEFEAGEEEFIVGPVSAVFICQEVETRELHISKKWTVGR
jgi:hypothetical protein